MVAHGQACHAKAHVTPKPMCKGLTSATLLTVWMIWKQRNTYTFDNEWPSVSVALDRIRIVVALWAKAVAAGLRDIIPTTWDVH
jgi:hypothetical protein